MSIVVPDSTLLNPATTKIGFEQSAGFSLGSLVFDESTSSVSRLKWDEAGNVTDFDHSSNNDYNIGTDAFIADDDVLLYTSTQDISFVSVQIAPVLIMQSTAPNPVPEPNTIILSVIGLVGIGYLRRRNKSVCVTDSVILSDWHV